MRELRIEATFVYNEEDDVGEVIKEFQALYAKRSNNCLSRFEVYEEEHKPDWYKILCPHCNGVISGYVKEYV